MTDTVRALDDRVDENELFFALLERPTTKDLPVKHGVLAAVLRERTAGFQRLHARITSVETRARSVSSGDTSALEQLIATLEQRLDERDERIKQLEQRPYLKCVGVWSRGATYKVGQIVNNDGSSWGCTETHDAGDRFDHSRFQLLSQRGPQGPRGRDAV